MVQWLGLCTFTAVGLGLISGWGTRIPQAARHGKKKKKMHTELYWAWWCRILI